jgi:O-antigen/teichoic acid export membrane protein
MAGIKKNFLYNSAYQILLIIAPLITTPYLSRVIGADGNGVFTYTQSIANYFVMFATLGMSNYGVRLIAECGDDREKRSRQFSSALVLCLIICAIVTACYIAFILTCKSSQLGIWLLWIMWIIGAATDVSWLFFGMQEFRAPTIRNFFTKLASIAIIFLLVRTSDDVWAYVAAIAGSYLANSLLILPFVRRYVDPVRPTPTETLSHLKPNVMLFVPVIATSFYTVLDKIMLGSMAGMTQVGLFDYSMKISQMPMAVITALGAVVLPKMTRVIAAGDKAQARTLIKLAMWFMQACAFGLMFGVIGIAPEFVPVFFGEGYETCVPLMTVTSLIIPLICFTNVVGIQFLLPCHRDKDFTMSLLAGAAVNIVLNLVLIPRYGALGTAWASVAAETTVFTVQTFMVRNNLDIRSYLASASPYMVIAAIMAIGIRTLSYSLGNLAPTVEGLTLECFIGVAIYLAMCFAWCYLRKDSNFKQIFPRIARW